MLEIRSSIQYAKAKLRNIVYYRLSVEPIMKERFRCQYMHVLRQFRKDNLALLERIAESHNPEFKEDYILLSKAVDMISPKIKTEECLSTIKNLSSLLNEQKGQEKS